MKVLSAYSIKGGVGKTATAVNLAYLSALEGARTLLWDLDPQAAATYYLGAEPGVKGGGKKLVFGDSELAGMISPTRYPDLDLIPSDFRYRKLDVFLDRGKKPHEKLDRLLAPLAADYDCVLMDCPPGINLLSESVFYSSDALLVPIIPTTLSVRAYDLLVKFISDEQQKKRIRNVQIVAFCSLVDRRKSLHMSFVEMLPEERPGVLPTIIPSATEVEKMGVHRAPVHTYAAASRAAAAYEELWRAVRGRLGNSWLGLQPLAMAR
jgi:cellulose biosynthesis protein BcsQ